MERVNKSKIWLEVKPTVNSLNNRSFGKLYKEFISDIVKDGVKLIQVPDQELIQWPEVTINDNLISELDESGYR